MTKAPSKGPNYVEGEYIIKLNESARGNAPSNKSFIDVRVESDFKLFKDFKVIKINTKKNNINEVLSFYKNHRDVKYIEPNYIYTIDDFKGFKEIPNDPLFNRLWGLHKEVSEDSTIRPDIDAPEAWNISTGSKNIVVAVIDTGIDYNHEDLKENMWINEGETGLDENGNPKATNGIDDDGNGFVDDVMGWDFANNDNDPYDDQSHGTHCAGTIGAEGNNGIGVAGVTWNVSLMPIKFLTGTGSGSLEDAIKSIEYAIINKAQIMSNSWGGGGFSQALFDVIKEAERHNILFVAAAGNSSTNNDFNPQYPASYESENIISVASSTSSEDLSSFSCYGKKSVHIVAPGSSILSTTPRSGYDFKSGTSMAAPHVSGAAALVLSHFGEMPYQELKQRLLETTDKFRNYKNKVKSGGRLNVFNALTGYNPEPPWPVIDPALWTSFNHIIESDHPYENNFEKTWHIKHEGAKYIRVHFSKLELENSYDFVYIKDKNGNEIEKINGTTENYLSEAVPGDSLEITLKTDGTINFYGFKIDSYQIVTE
jgi:thermitase